MAFYLEALDYGPTLARGYVAGAIQEKRLVIGASSVKQVFGWIYGNYLLNEDHENFNFDAPLG